MTLLRRDDAAQRVALWQDDAAVIDFRLGGWKAVEGWMSGALDESSAACRAPVGLGVRGEYGMALGANAFHQVRV